MSSNTIQSSYSELYCDYIKGKEIQSIYAFPESQQLFPFNDTHHFGYWTHTGIALHYSMTRIETLGQPQNSWVLVILGSFPLNGTMDIHELPVSMCRPTVTKVERFRDSRNSVVPQKFEKWNNWNFTTKLLLASESDTHPARNFLLLQNVFLPETSPSTKGGARHHTLSGYYFFHMLEAKSYYV